MSHKVNPESIFHHARQINEPAEREEYLRGVCGSNRELREKLDVLLQADAALGDFFVEPSELVSSGAASPPATREKCGDVLGEYKLLEEIGEGGFGTVWMAEQRKPLKRLVALKLIKTGMDTQQVIARFEVERQALAMMDHPNIAKVYDAGTTMSGRPFFVMELVRGIPVAEYCDREHLPTEARLDLFESVCRALQHAHQKGVIHRDIKPSNVLITMHDGVPVAKVIDFGIAKAIDQELTERTLFTEFRQMIGTPAYMSPEQAEMSGLDIDTRADIYSLGVLLYELLTGTTPFDVNSLLQVGYEEMLRTIREDEPPKPSTRISTLGKDAQSVAERQRTDVRGLGIKLRGDLDWIAMKCLEKDRRRRYQTANALAEDVRRHRYREPVAAGPPSRVYRLRKFVQRHRKSAVAIAILFCTLVIGVTGSTSGMVWAQREEARVRAQSMRASTALQKVTERNIPLMPVAAVDSAVNAPAISREVDVLAATAVQLVQDLETARQGAERELHRALEVKRVVQEMLSGVDSVAAQTMDTSLLKQIFIQSVARLDAGEVSDELVDAELRATIGQTYLSMAEYDLAEPMLRACRQMAGSA